MTTSHLFYISFILFGWGLLAALAALLHEMLSDEWHFIGWTLIIMMIALVGLLLAATLETLTG